MKFTFNVNIEKKHVLALFFLVAIAGISLVIAEATISEWTIPTDGVWHNASSVVVKIDNKLYDLQTAIDNNLILTAGDSSGTPTPTGGVIQTFSIPAGGEADYTKECSACKANQIMTDPLTREQKCCTGVVGVLGRHCFGGSVVPLDRSKLSQYKQNITLNSGVVVESGRYYDFSCTYGSDTASQIHTIQLNETEQVIAKVSEPHFVRDYAINLPWRQDVYEGTDNFAFYAYALNGSMVIRVKNVEPACREVYINIGATSAGTELQCTPSPACPVYSVASGVTSYEYYAWKNLRCTIKSAS